MTCVKVVKNDDGTEDKRKFYGIGHNVCKPSDKAILLYRYEKELYNLVSIS